MSKTRQLADLLDSNGDIKSGRLDNVPASNDASALTTGTLPNARLASIPNSALANPSITINGNATALGGSATVGGDALTRDVTLASGASVTDAKIINTNQSGQVEQYPTVNTVGTYVDDTDLDTASIKYSSTGGFRIKYSSANVSNKSRLTITGQILNADGTYTTGSSATLDTNSNGSTSSGGYVGQWKDNYWVAYSSSSRGSDGDYQQDAIQMFTINTSNGNISMLGTRYTVANNFDRRSGGINYATHYGGTMSASIGGHAPYISGNAIGYSWSVKLFKSTTGGLTNHFSWSGGTHNNRRTSQTNPNIDDASRRKEISSNRILSMTSTGLDVLGFTGSSSGHIVQSSLPFNSSEYNGDGIGIFLNSTHFLYFFKDIYNKRRAQTYSFSNTTFTKIDDFEYEDGNLPTVLGAIQDIKAKSATELALKTSTGLSAIELDSNYNVVGVKTPLVISGLTGEIPYISGNTFLTYNRAANGMEIAAPYTVNAYSDDFPFIYGGVAQETSSSGTAKVCYGGIADGFTGLTVGVKYYVDPNLGGDITTATTSGIVVGTAISPTEILIGDVR